MMRFLCLFSSVLLIGCTDGPKDGRNSVTLNGQALGTTWMVKVWGFNPVEEDKLRDEIASKIEELERILSHWRPDSKLYQFNASLSAEPVSIPPLLHELLTHAKWTHEQTGGAFDPTIAPLVNLWGFGPISDNRTRTPTVEEINHALKQVGMNQLEILTNDRVRKKIPSLQIDLSGSAKGEIIDQVCALLDRRGIGNYLVEIGGEIRTRGPGKDERGWRVALEDGFRGSERFTLSLRDYSVATSGTYRQSKPNPDSAKPANHLIDPRTGRPVEHDLVTVNVLAPTVRDADALATALMILGPEKGMALAEEMDLSARFCLKDANGTRMIFSPNYQRLLDE